MFSCLFSFSFLFFCVHCFTNYFFVLERKKMNILSRLGRVLLWALIPSFFLFRCCFVCCFLSLDPSPSSRTTPPPDIQNFALFVFLSTPSFFYFFFLKKKFRGLSLNCGGLCDSSIENVFTIHIGALWTCWPLQTPAGASQDVQNVYVKYESMYVTESVSK